MVKIESRRGMSTINPSPEWPPRDGREFIRSEAFGYILIAVVTYLARKYRNMDFTDAVANVFAWFDHKLSEDPAFISAVKFPTQGSFLAYLRQATWNAARLAERERKRHRQVGPLPDGRGIIVREVDPEELSLLLEAVDSLPEPHKTIFHRYFMDEEDLSMLGSIYDLTEEQIYDIYSEATDLLAEKLG
jgi:hypothetical protein